MCANHLASQNGQVIRGCYAAKRASSRSGATYLNDVLIPALCRKAAVPKADVRGNITSHRGRSTIASQLFNAKQPMTPFELQEWLGHSTPAATQNYARITPTKLAKSYADAGYFKRNLRAIEVLVDQEVVRSGRAASEPWKFYDLGHGYRTYDFFEQCPHRMDCAKCSFYMPKHSSQVQLLEGKANLLQLRQDIPLSEAEVAAVDDGVAAMEKLLEQLVDAPTPAGPTPRNGDPYTGHCDRREVNWHVPLPATLSTFSTAAPNSQLLDCRRCWNKR